MLLGMLINFMSDWRHVWSSDGSKSIGLPPSASLSCSQMVGSIRSLNAFRLENPRNF